MPESSKIREFPDISNKLTAPTKKSLFERQKAEAEAKRQREEAETAAVYEDFVRSFEDDSGASASAFHGGGSSAARPGAPPPGLRAGGGGAASRRHFAPSSAAGMKTGLAPPRRRAPIDAAHALFAFEDAPAAAALPAATNNVKAAFQASDDEDDDGRNDKYYDGDGYDVEDDRGGRGVGDAAEERAASKPTLHLASLPPGTTAAGVRALIPSALTVDGVRMLAGPQTGQAAERRALAAIVTLAKESPASEMDAAVSALQNRYLGCGFRLSISRHLSSALLGSGGVAGLGLASSASSAAAAHPFGARPVFNAAAHPLNRAPPPSSRGGYAPPAAYGRGDGFARGGVANGPLRVSVKPPSDVRQLKLIHKTVEAVLTHGPEFEALLMSRRDIQLDDKWAWLWDSRSAGGVWYRWRLWEVLTSGGRARGAGASRPVDANNVHTLFSGSAPWQAPERSLRFEFTTEFASFVSDPDYDSEEEEDSGDDEARPAAGAGAGTNADGEAGGVAEYLNPLQKAKLTHLLARLPTSTARLRRGDVARVTAFAIKHAGRGSDEVVRMLIDNVERPFALSAGANPGRRSGQNSDSDGEEEREKEDPSSAKLIGLFLISDLLSSSSTSGVRHAWRYRQLFEAALRARRLFPRLGRLERELGWGKMRADKWRRAVGQLLALWEGWCVFASAAHEELVRGFAESVESIDRANDGSGRKPVDEAARRAQQNEIRRSAWRTVADNTSGEVPQQALGEDVDGLPMEDDGSDGDLDGQPMDEDDDEGNVDGEPMQDESDRGEPMDQDDGGSEQQDDHRQHQQRQQHPASEDDPGSRAAEARRRRPRAVDMFADSEGE